LQSGAIAKKAVFDTAVKKIQPTSSQTIEGLKAKSGNILRYQRLH
jgi:hypothetical protein